MSAAAAAAAGPCPRAERGQDEVPEIPDGAADGHRRHPVQSRQSPAAQEEAVVRTRGWGAPTGQWGYPRSTETGAPGAGPGRVDRGQGRRSRAGARGLAAVGRAELAEQPSPSARAARRAPAGDSESARGGSGWDPAPRILASLGLSFLWAPASAAGWQLHAELCSRPRPSSAIPWFLSVRLLLFPRIHLLLGA